MATWDEFISAATAGKTQQALQWMYARAAKEVFDGCYAFALSHGDDFKSFWDSVPYGERVPDLILDLVYYGHMPQRPYGEVGFYDYDTIRELLLRSYERSRQPSWWPSRHVNATSVCMYPEYARRQMSLRAAVIRLAEDHNGGGPADAWQANLFCLGGRYTWTIGKQGSHPTGPGTTCMLFARSILHAAGINVIGPNTPKSCSCDKGLNAELQHLNSYVKIAKGSPLPSPTPGDVFHIRGKNFGKPGAEYGSDHVGIITHMSGNRWTVVQGGAGDHRTKSTTYTVQQASDRSWGDWHFAEDQASVEMIRGLQGFWNLDYIGSASRMRGGVG